MFRFVLAAIFGASLLAVSAAVAENQMAIDFKPEDVLLDEIAVRLRNINKQFAGGSHPGEKQRSRFAYYPHEAQFRRRYFNQFHPLVSKGDTFSGDPSVLQLKPRLEEDGRRERVGGSKAIIAIKESNLAGKLNPLTNDISPAEKSISPVAIPADHSIGHERHIKRGPLGQTSNTPLIIAGVVSIVLGTVIIGFAVYINRWTSRVKKLSEEMDYPAYGVTGPGKSGDFAGSLKKSASVPWFKPKRLLFQGDQRLAHSAHMFHFHHQKQQVMAAEQSYRAVDPSGNESEEDNEEGDYTVYECPGLAPTGEMEVKNPMYLDETTPAAHGHP